MGHRDSPAQFGRHGGFFVAGRGTAAFDSPQGRSGNPGRNQLARAAAAGAGWALLTLLRLYQVFLSPFFGGACKYHPSCSNYAYEAIERHGAGPGIVLALKRLGRCRPFVPGGYDPVPDDRGVPLRAPCQRPAKLKPAHLGSAQLRSDR